MAELNAINRIETWELMAIIVGMFLLGVTAGVLVRNDNR